MTVLPIRATARSADQIRSRLDALLDAIHKNESPPPTIKTEGEIDRILLDNNISCRLLPFPPVKDDGLRDLRMLFNPVDSSVVDAKPITPRTPRSEVQKRNLIFHDYDPENEFLTLENRVIAASNYFEYWVYHVSSWKHNWTSRLHHDLEIMSHPNPFYRLNISGISPNFAFGSSSGTKHEYTKPNGEGIYPHVCFTAQHFLNGTDNTIFWGELVMIIRAIHNRANQLKVDEDGKELSPEEFEFDGEKRFPVMMASFFGPQHGRILCASLKGDNLEIFKSPIQSFEKKDLAPWNPFTYLFLAAPRQESGF